MSWGGVGWLCHCPRGVSTKSVLGGLSGYVTVLGGVYKKCLGGVVWLHHRPRGCV